MEHPAVRAIVEHHEIRDVPPVVTEAHPDGIQAASSPYGRDFGYTPVMLREDPRERDREYTRRYGEGVRRQIETTRAAIARSFEQSHKTQIQSIAVLRRAKSRLEELQEVRRRLHAS